MTTAAAIEEITDVGQFEILAVRVLRLVDKDCRRIEHLGVNAEGKTIPGALDAFVLVSGSSPPRFVMAAFTTRKRKDLKDKWLFDHSESRGTCKGADDGDLIKAAQKAAAIRKNHPDAEFIVHLCTNKRLDSDLMSAVYAKAAVLRLRAEFLAQSQIRDCLDMTPDGQWLRKEHLGIPAERVSEGLLRELSAESVRRYAQEFLITQPDRFIRTTAGERLSTSVGTRSRTLHVVLGASGVGKSVVSYQALSDHIQSGGIGFWIPGEVATRSSSLEEAIDQVLRALHSAIEPGAGAAALRLRTAQKKLLLITDDVNRSRDPRNVLRRIASWARPAVADGTSTVAPATFGIVVPAWDVFWGRFHEFLNEQPWLGVIPVALMSLDEAVG